MPTYQHSVLTRVFLYEPAARDYNKDPTTTTSILTYKPFFSLFGEHYVGKDDGWKTAIGYAFQSLERSRFHVIRLQTNSDFGDQRVAYYVGAKNSNPNTIWFCCNGTSQFALDLLDFLAKIRIPIDVGFLLYEIPGYGDCEGLPTLANILQTAYFAEAALANYFQTNVATIRDKISIFGYSIGCAVMSLYASNVGIKNCVLVAPFVSMKKAVHRVVNSSKSGIVGWLAAETASLVAPRFDNEAYIKTIIAKNPNDAKIEIFHGTNDTICEFEGSVHLSNRFQSNVKLTSFNGAGHDILRMVFLRICSL